MTAKIKTRLTAVAVACGAIAIFVGGVGTSPSGPHL
jgi:hypothetical protein